jgi:biopolymer transport protein ExbD
MPMLTPIQKRAIRKSRNSQMVDMNLVSLIDVFTILIFFLLSSATEVEVLPSSRAVKLPESTTEKAPRETVVVIVSGNEILVQGRTVASVQDAMALQGDVIAPLQQELQDYAARSPLLAANKDQGRAVTIMGDKDIPYQLLRKVMVTSARANFTEVSFAVRPKGQS